MAEGPWRSWGSIPEERYGGMVVNKSQPKGGMVVKINRQDSESIA